MPTNQTNCAQAATVVTRFANLKTRLLLEHLNATPEPESHAEIIKQASEAAIAAWNSGYPLLVFPCLFEESALVAIDRVTRQSHGYWDNFQAPVPAPPAPEAQRVGREAFSQIGAARKSQAPGSYLVRLRQHQGTTSRFRLALSALPATA